MEVGKVFVKLAERTAERVAARWSRRAGIEAIDLTRIEKLRKDFLLLIKNVKKLLATRAAPGTPGYEHYVELYGEFQPIVRGYRAAFEDLIFDRFLDKAVKWDERLGPDGARSMERMLRKPARRLSGALLLSPDPMHPDDLKAWDRKTRRLAQDFWKSAKGAIEWYKAHYEGEMTVQVPDQLVLEGFRVQIINYDPNDDNDPAALEKFREAIRVYRRRASKTLPWLINNQVPMVLDFKVGVGGNAGTYSNGIIRIDAHTIGLGMVHVLAHEMGHHMYKRIKGSAKQFWETAIKQDYGPLDLRELLAMWPVGDRYASDFVERMAAVDPVLAIQVDVLSYGHGHGVQLTRRDDFVDTLEWMDGKDTKVNVPKTPITGYAGKSPEEALCEAVGLLVAYGPGAIHETIRHWLTIALPGRVKFAGKVQESHSLGGRQMGASASTQGPRAKLATVSLRKLAPKSINGETAMVTIEGVGRVWAEPHDGDDTFPPAIASYEFKDGWLVYHGRNGSVGAIVGTERELKKWIHGVKVVLEQAPVETIRPWESSDGGKANLTKAIQAARRVWPSIKVEFFVSSKSTTEGDHAARAAQVVNAHLDSNHKLGNTSVHSGSAIAAHEAAHAAFSHNSTAGREVMEVLKQWGRKVSMYHALAGDFEGVMDAAAWWAMAPRDMQASAPEVFQAMQTWLGGAKTAQRVARRFLAKSSKAKRSKCMRCSAKPTVAYRWADGRGLAWFCDKCGKAWKKEEERDIVRTIKVDDGVMPTKIAALKPINKKVVDAFVAKEPFDHPKSLLSTDGRSLYRQGMGSEKFAVWRGSQIAVVSRMGTKFPEMILRYLNKVARRQGVTVAYSDLQFRSGGDQLYAGQWDGWITVSLPGSSDVIGRLDWSAYQGEYQVKMVEVEPEYRRSGIATALYQKLFKDQGITKRDLVPSLRTPEGDAFRRVLGDDGHFRSSGSPQNTQLSIAGSLSRL